MATLLQPKCCLFYANLPERGIEKGVTGVPKGVTGGGDGDGQQQQQQQQLLMLSVGLEMLRALRNA